MFHSFLLYLGLEEDFQGHNEMAFLEPSQVHIPKFSLAQRTPDFKVINCELPPNRGRRKSLSLGVRWRERVRDPKRSPSSSTFLSLCPFLFSRARPGCLVSSSQSHTHSLLFTSPSHFLSSSRYNAKGTHVVGTLGSV